METDYVAGENIKAKYPLHKIRNTDLTKTNQYFMNRKQRRILNLVAISLLAFALFLNFYNPGK